jgi:hypothetical protein
MKLPGALARAVNDQPKRGASRAEQIFQCVLDAVELVMIHAQLHRSNMAVSSDCSNKSVFKGLGVTGVRFSVIYHVIPAETQLATSIAHADVNRSLLFEDLGEHLPHQVHIETRVDE